MAGKTRSIQLKSAHDWHVYNVYHDAEFKKAIQMLSVLEKRPSSTNEQIEGHKRSLARSYMISVADINLYMLPLYLENQTKTTAMSFDPDTKQFSIMFEPTTTKAELLEEWGRFEDLRAAVFPAAVVTTKRKPPEYPDLTYAIFKCRRKGLSFPEIFEHYQTRRLPNYTKSPTQFGDARALERYYDKYKPMV